MISSKIKIKFLIVHCSDTPNTDNLKAIDIHKGDIRKMIRFCETL